MRRDGNATYTGDLMRSRMKAVSSGFWRTILLEEVLAFVPVPSLVAAGHLSSLQRCDHTNLCRFSGGHSAAKPRANVQEAWKFEHEVVNVMTSRVRRSTTIFPPSHTFDNVLGLTQFWSSPVELELSTTVAKTREVHSRRPQLAEKERLFFFFLSRSDARLGIFHLSS